MLLVQVGVVVAVVVLITVTCGVIATLSSRDNAQQTALGIARSTASDAELIAAVDTESQQPGMPDRTTIERGAVQSIAESVRLRTGALFVVVTDDRGLRLAHPNPLLLGERVSTDPSAALAGEESTSWQAGTLGDSARAKVPVRTADGRIVGEVSVGIGADSVFRASVADVTAIAVAAAIALAIGATASILLSRRLRRQTLGLQPSELAGMVLDQSAVISGIGEGVVGITAGGVVSVCNGRASTLLQLTDAVGRPFDDLDLPGELRAAVRARQLPASPAGSRTRPRRVPTDAGQQQGESTELRLAVDDRLLYLDVARVSRAEVALGVVVVVRDETDLASLSQRLEVVEASSRALRVQRHEFSNRLHVISGLIEAGRPGDARDYLSTVLDRGSPDRPFADADLLTEPFLRAFLGAKAIEAAERGVSLRIGPETAVGSTLSRPEKATTVLGNLVDNAITAAALSAREPRWVQVDALDDGRDLHLVVSDSGDGLGDDAVRMLFQPVAHERGHGGGGGALGGGGAGGVADGGAGPVHGLGVGLPLIRDLARRNGGDVWLATAHSSDAGAVFCARLVEVLSGAAGHRGDGHGADAHPHPAGHPQPKDDE
ncbi:two-component system CitB family sensor kinase [Subtercola boreus]|nr:two-component system CitB family sensor kinase [Subtercola boreus]